MVKKKSKPKPKLKSIRILRAEGRGEEVGKSRRFKSFRAANAQLTRNSRTAPKRKKAYDKHEFVVTWTDGSKYKGRYDLHRNEAGNLKKHMTNFINYLLSKRFDRHTYIPKKEREAQRKEARVIKRLLK